MIDDEARTHRSVAYLTATEHQLLREYAAARRISVSTALGLLVAGALRGQYTVIDTRRPVITEPTGDA
jgi:hypothetical protein